MISLSDKENAFSEVHQMLQGQIEVIAEHISGNKAKEDDYGLLGGKAGVTLLFAYLSKVFPEKKYLQTTYDYLDELVDTLANEELHYNMSGGAAGIAFVFQHLRNIGILDKGDDLNLTELDEFLGKGIESDFSSGNWDPLHGMIGLGIYFLERNKETGDKKYLEKITDHLATMRSAHGEYKLWITPGFQKFSNDNYNFGMAHGIPGILSFLAQVHLLGIRQSEIKEMILSALPYILQNKFPELEACQFPSSVDVNSNEEAHLFSRLAWCYGDLCIAFMLLHCGKALKDELLKNKGIEIALKTTQRTFENSGCIDAPLCHGSVGIAHQYNRLYQYTGNEAFKVAADKWLNITMQQFYKSGEGSGGYYSAVHNSETGKYENTTVNSLLEGGAGIALIYLSIINNIKPDWDIIFLTNV